MAILLSNNAYFIGEQTDDYSIWVLLYNQTCYRFDSVNAKILGKCQGYSVPVNPENGAKYLVALYNNADYFELHKGEKI